MLFLREDSVLTTSRVSAQAPREFP
jgi:hypothetical protein